MKIRKLVIRNFRGVKKLDWEIPESSRLLALIGPGDSGKSTVLTAIEYLLGDRWNIPFSDSDFFGGDVDNEICIQAFLTDIPNELLKDSALGLYLCGTTTDHRFNSDPLEGFDPSLAVQLKVSGSLEPEWTVLKNGEEHRLTSAHRRKFGIFSVDSRSEAQLRWSHTSALGRLSAESKADRKILAEANRAAQQAIASGNNEELTDLTDRIQAAINSIGAGKFTNIGAGLDTYRNSLGANLALYEGELPLSSYGLGSKRLASLAVQQLYAGKKSVVLLDEIEMGLEPHRVISLIQTLKQDDHYSQVFITTHSTIVVEQVDMASLTVVRNNMGVVSVKTIGDSSERFAKIRRGRPSSLLAQKILLCEGKTEYGIIKGLLETWDQQQFDEKKPISSSLGFTFSDADGGSEVAPRAEELRSLGYDVAGFMDSDDTNNVKAVERAEKVGVKIYRWEDTLNTETQVCKDLGFSQLECFAKKHASKQKHLNSALKDLREAWGEEEEPQIHSLSAVDWQNDGVDIQRLRHAMGHAAHKNGWYKDIDRGEALGRWLLENESEPAFAAVWSVLNQVKAFVYKEES